MEKIRKTHNVSFIIRKILEDKDIFTKEEINVISNNEEVLALVYLLGIIDAIKLITGI